MKTSLKYLSLFLAASIPGVALTEIATVTTLFPVQAPELISTFAVISILLIAVSDYAPRVRKLVPGPRAVRPSMPTASRQIQPGRQTVFTGNCAA